MTKKLMKILGISALTLLLLLGGAALLLVLFFPAGQVREQVEKQLQRATGRECRVESAGISIRRGLALDLKNLRIASLEQETVPFLLGVEHLYLKMKLLPLLRKRIEIVSLALVGVEIYLERDKGGALNLNRLLAPEETLAAESPAGEPEGKQFSLVLHSASLERAGVHYFDRRDSLELALGPLDGKFLLLDRGAETPLNIGGELTLGGLESPGSELVPKLAALFPLRVTGAFSLDMDKGNLACADLQAGFSGIGLSGQASFTGLGKAESAWSVALEGGAARLQELSGLLSAFISKGVKIDPAGGELKLAASLQGASTDTAGPDYRISASLGGVEAQVEGFPRRITVNQAQLGLVPGELRLEKISAALGGDPLSLSGKVFLRKGNPFNLRLEASLTLEDLPRALPALGSWRPRGKVNAALELHGALENPGSTRASGTVEGRDLLFRPPDSLITYEIPRLSLRSAGENLESLKLDLRAGQSRLELSAAVRNYRALFPGSPVGSAPPADWDLEIRAPLLDVNDFYLTDPVTGELTGWMARGETVEIPHAFGKGKGSLRADTLIISKQLGLRRAAVDFTVLDSLVRLERISGGTYSGGVSGQGQFLLTGRGLSAFAFDLTADSLSARELLTPFSGLGKNLTGLVKAEFQLTGAGEDADRALKNLSGAARFSLREGELRGWPVLVSLANLTGIEELRDLVLEDWTGAFTIRGERVYGDNLQIRSPVSDFRFAGSSGFDGTLDYALSLVLSEPLTRKYRGRMPGEIASLLTGKENRLELNLKIGGTTDQPKVSWDSRPVAERLTRKLGGQLNKLLDRLLPGGGQASADSTAVDSAAARGDSTARPAAADPAKKVPELLKNLLKKKKGPGE